MFALQKNIKKLRALKGLNQAEFAKIFGLTRANIGSYEEGRAQPKMEVVVKMADYFGIRLDEFVSKELTVNDLSGFKNLPENKVMAIQKESPLATIPYVEEKSIKKFLSIGRSAENLTLPREFGADFALRFDHHYLESKNGIPNGSILLLKEVNTNDIQNGKVHVIWNKKEVVIGISTHHNGDIHIRGLQSENNLKSIPTKCIDHVWRVESTISTQKYNLEENHLIDRINDLEKNLKEIISASK